MLREERFQSQLMTLGHALFKHQCERYLHSNKT